MRLSIVIAVLALSSSATAATYEITSTDDLFARLGMLQPGDEVIVHTGTYTTPGFLEVTWAGEAARPIIVRAADGEHPIIQGTPAQNVINLRGAYFTLSGFEIRGGSHGIRLKGVSNATLENLVLHDLGDVGISCNFAPENCDALTIRHDEIYDTGKAGTGEGMYLGCNDATCTFTNSIIENNYVHDLGGDQGDGIEIKTGAWGNVVRDNVIVRSKYPGITMYGYAGTHPVNIVERNLVWHATVDNGIQVVGQVIVRNNIVIDAAANGIQSKASQGFTPIDVTIENNTIVSASVCMKTNDWGGGTNQRIANNALYCEGATAIDVNGGAGADVEIASNLGLGSSTVASGFAVTTGTLATDLDSPATGNVYPPLSSKLLDVGAGMVGDDFNGTARVAPIDIGAYERTTATNPGWMVVEGFKTPVASQPGAEGGNAGHDDTQVPREFDGCCSTSSHTEVGGFVALLAFVLRRRRRS